METTLNQAARLDPLSRPLLPIRRFSELKLGEQYPLPANRRATVGRGRRS